MQHEKKKVFLTLTMMCIFVYLKLRSTTNGAVVPKALPMIASRLSPNGACEKVASDLGIGGCFCRVLRFCPPVTAG